MLSRLAPLALVAVLIGGCAIKDKTYTPSEAEGKLVAFCQKESANSHTFLADEFKNQYSSNALVQTIKHAGLKVPAGKDDVDILNRLLNSKELTARFARLSLPQEARALQARKKPLQDDELKRLNRLVLETAFADKCPKSLSMVTHLVENALWVYVPFSEPIFTVKPSDPAASERKKTPLDLLYLGGEYDEKTNFSFEYDIVSDTLPPDPATYGSGYNEKFARIRQLIYQGLQESIFNIPPKDAPEFVIVIVADTTTGVAIKSTLYLNDLKQYLTEAIPSDEYYQREQNEIIGDKAMAADITGKSLKYDGVEWPDFLVGQIKARIKYKFGQSDFQPDSDPDKIIAACAANALKFYPFTAYKGVYLYNIRQKRDMLFDKKQLKTFEEESWWAGKGKLTTIHFDAGQFNPEKKTTTTTKTATP